MLRRFLILACLLGFVVPASAARPQPPTQAAAPVVVPALKETLEKAAKRRLPTLVEFRAPWCYSCYYMARHVHIGIEWDELKRRALVAEVDADSPQGAAQMQAWNLKPLPAYVVLDAQGREIGRILGEQTREAFYAQMESLLAPGARLDDLRVTASAGGKKGRDAADSALKAFYARDAAEEGLRWFYDLPGRVRRAYEPDQELNDQLARLRLMEAAQGEAPEVCASVAPAVFAKAGCELPYVVQRYQACVGKPETPDGLLRGQRTPLENLVETQVFGDGPRCADERSAVLVLADLQGRLGEAEARKRTLNRAIENLQARVAEDLGRDRSAADNLRVYIEMAQRWEDYDALMPRLIATWPDDYVYPYRFGRSLLDRERPSEALPYLERAATRAYGENRLRVAEQRVKALKRLGRIDDAKRVAAEALKANGPWFPAQAAALKAQL
jgi:hypothetical protein